MTFNYYTWDNLNSYLRSPSLVIKPITQKNGDDGVIRLVEATLNSEHDKPISSIEYKHLLEGWKNSVFGEIDEHTNIAIDEDKRLKYIRELAYDLSRLRNSFYIQESDDQRIFCRKDYEYSELLTEGEKPFPQDFISKAYEAASQYFEHQFTVITSLYEMAKDKLYAIGGESEINKLNQIENPSLPQTMNIVDEDNKITIDKLDIYHTALLFYFLKENGGILPLTNTKLGEHIGALTGYSKNKLRSDKGFGMIPLIINDKVKNQNYKDTPNYNLTSVRKFIKNVLDDIDSEISKAMRD